MVKFQAMPIKRIADFSGEASEGKIAFFYSVTAFSFAFVNCFAKAKKPQMQGFGAFWRTEAT
jgi:hypothetical protein